MISRMGVKARFTLLYAMALIIAVLLVSGGMYFFIQHILMKQIDNHLQKDLATIQEYLKYDLSSLEIVADRGPILLFRVRVGNKPVVLSDDWITSYLERIIPPDIGHKSVFSGTVDGKRYRVRLDTAEHIGPNFQIAVAHSEKTVRQTLKTLALIIMLILPLAVLSSLAIGYLIAGRVLAPIRDITDKAEEIGAENLSERLPVGETEDEFSRLAIVFNQTFARIEDSFERLQSFTADASHELRTPLAAIRSIGETVLHAPDEQVNCREAISSILEESDRLRQLIDALLQLSRADAGEIVLRREAVDLAVLVRETVEFLNVLAEEKHQVITVTAGEKAVAEIDRASVRQALTNLLDNAIKYTPAESKISITVGTTDSNEAFVEIADSGIGIPAGDIGRIFDRFYRVDKGRSRKSGGVGLGLSITKWAIESNGGRIEVKSTVNQGSVFRVLFHMS